METIYKGKKLTPTEQEKIWEILCECNGEFYPPLSYRNSSSQTVLNLSAETNTEKIFPTEYFTEMICQDFILAQEGNKIAGFMTFKQHYICEALEPFGPSLYITTACVTKSQRRQGILNQLYETIEKKTAISLGCPRISTRTWSLNYAQINSLQKRGYHLSKVLKNDRGPGVDTLYFTLSLDL